MLIASLLVLLQACAVNPATGERELSFVSEAQEIQMGRQADPAATAQFGGLYPDQALQDYVTDLGMSIARVSERPNLPWSFKLVDHELINAFALPGGYIYLTRGILANMNSEAELVGVLAHEVGHDFRDGEEQSRGLHAGTAAAVAAVQSRG
jgi:predicted Zn-dependent protease